MAEAIILPIAKSTLLKIATLTGNFVMTNATAEIKAFSAFDIDLKAMAEDLESVTSVLQDAGAKQYSNNSMKIWLRDLKRFVYDIDDLLDEIATDALQRSLNNDHFLPRLWYHISLTPLILQVQFSHKIKDLRLEFNRIVEKKNKFGLTDSPTEAPPVARDVLDTCDVNKLDILGRVEAKNNIINRVLSLGDECNLSVLPILGMGGSGKTALAKLVHADIDHFDIKLWACVSDKFDIQKILEDILKGATSKNTSNDSVGDLVKKLQKNLNSKRFFLVLDDLWEDGILLWEDLKDILAVGGKGSVILITTRLETVSSATRTVEPYYVEKLSDSVCWCIFEKLAFVDEEERDPKLCEIGKSIVEKCFGNPLIVRSLGSLLRNEKEEEWVRIRNMDNLNQLVGRYDVVKQLLKLSYDKLPSHLKLGFAHLSLYGKDYVYASHYHLYCWSALGLLQLHDGSYFNHNFFNELLSRSMLQDVKWSFDNTVVKFKVHDLLHDIAGDVLGEEVAIVTGDQLNIPDSTRYISWGLGSLSDKEFPKQIKATKARAFIFRYGMRRVSPSFLKGIISSMPYLRILCFAGSQFIELPSSIGNLKHLRVLNLASNYLIESLPGTISGLVNLECLLLTHCKKLEKLPTEIYKLIRLRLFSLTTWQGSLIGTKFNRLPSLRHLLFFSSMRLVSLWEGEDVGRLTSLRSLRITNCPKLTSLPNSMKLLVGLEEWLIGNCEELDLERGESLSGLVSLRTLGIKGVPRLSCLPNGICSAARSLKYFWISECIRLAELPTWLQSFTSLKEFTIRNCPHISRRYATPDSEDLSLIRHIPVFWLDDSRLTPNKQ